jgi:hypothetical protein
VSFGFTQTFLERQFFAEDGFGGVYETNKEFRSVTQPTISLVSDNTLMGYYGPVNGQRVNLTFGPALGCSRTRSYNTVTIDARSLLGSDARLHVLHPHARRLELGPEPADVSASAGSRRCAAIRISSCSRRA